MNQTDKSFIKRTDERQTWHKAGKQRKKGTSAFFFFHTCCVSAHSILFSSCLSVHLWIIILCSPCDTEKLIGSQMGRWVCLCVREKGLEKYIFIHLYTCIATFIFLVNASVPLLETHMFKQYVLACLLFCVHLLHTVCVLCAHLRVFWQTLKRVFQCVYVFLISSL